MTRHERFGDTIPNCLGELGNAERTGITADGHPAGTPGAATLSASWHERMQGEKKERHSEVHLSRRTSSTASSPWPFEDSHRALATKTRMGRHVGAWWCRPQARAARRLHHKGPAWNCGDHVSLVR